MSSGRPRSTAADRAPTRAWLGLGANVGDRERTIRDALLRLDAREGCRVVRVSRLRDTEPVGGPPQPDFLNGAAEIETRLSARELLGVLKELEHAAGRRPGSMRNGPRPLDLDILLFGDARIEEADLTIPHPRIGERPFVLEPLRELGVEWGERARRGSSP